MIAESGFQRPILSVIICVVSDARHLEGCLTALLQQVDAPPMEIIVPYDGYYNDIPRLASRFPGVKFHRVDNFHSVVSRQGRSREHHDELRAIGLKMARGEIVALLEDHGRADRYWSMHIIKAHKDSHAAIGGAIENEVDQLLNWAIYFCDFGRYQNPLEAGPSPYISDANISYKRWALEQIKEVWQDKFHETTVNAILMNKGETLWLSPYIIVYQHRENLSLGQSLLERYVWGRSYAGTRASEITLGKRLAYLILSPMVPFILVGRKFRDVLRKKRLIGVFIRALPITFLLILSWSLGEFIGYWTTQPTANME